LYNSYSSKGVNSITRDGFNPRRASLPTKVYKRCIMHECIEKAKVY
jgi:hypothetical protein